MSFTGFFLRNRHAVWALVVAIVAFGLVAYRQIPVRLFPDTAPPLVNVVTAWPGATASDVHQDLTDVLETEFAALEGVAKTSSSSQDNLSMVTIEFQYGTDVKMAAVDVQNALSRIGEDLPGGSQQPRVMTFSTADRPIYTVAVVSDDLLAARRAAEDVIAPRMQAVEGVAAIDVFGGRVPMVLIDVDPVLAEAHHIALPVVAGAVQSSNLSLPAGRLRGDRGETMLRVDQRADRVEDLQNIPIPLADGGQLRLDTIATVRRDAERDDSWFAVNGQRTIAVQVYRSEDANTVAVVADVEQVITELEAELPSLSFVRGEEAASFTEQSVNNLLSNVWQALFLASAVLFLFLGRASVAMVTAFTMPLSFGLTFGVMWLLGMEFNMVTLSAVILAVGMVVDASVVVVENIVRLRDEGLSPMDAARQGTDEVILPVLAGVATTLAVLVPLLGLPGFVGKVFGPLAITLLIAFSSSVLVALVLVPILSLNVQDGGRLEAAAAWVSKPFQGIMDWLRDRYMGALDVGLRWRNVVVIAAMLAFAVGLAGVRMAGMDVLPRMDSGAFSVSVETPSGSSLVQTSAVVVQIEQVLAKHEEVLLVQSQAGFEPGMQFAGGSGVMGPTQGFISVTLSPRTERDRDIWQIEEAVRADIARIPGIANVVVKESGNTAKPTTIAPLVARVSGPDPLVLDALGDDVVTALAGVESIVQPTRAWRRDMERVLLSVEPHEALAVGQNPLSVARQLVMGAEGIDAGVWRSDQATAEPIEVRFARTNSPDVDEFLSWPTVMQGSGEIIPLRSVVKTRTAIEQGLFTSENLNPVLDVRAQIDGRPLSFVVADAELALADLDLPEGYALSIEGENSDLIESRVSILSALAVSVLAVYLLLVSQFRSWIHPVTVMMAVPLSLVGVAAAMQLTGQPVSMPVMVGLVLLVGTVVNNSILLIDIIRQRRDAGDERREAICYGVRSRFRPIMMTSLSTVIGMVPLALAWALGAERFAPLAIAVIGGLLASTLLTLIVIPVLYDIGDGLQRPTVKPPPGLAAAAVAAMLALLTVSMPASAQEMPMEQAWQLTLQHPAATSAGLRVDAAREQAHGATARMLPTLDLTARATELSYVQPALIAIPIQLPDGSTPDPVQLGEFVEQQYAIEVALTQPVYAGGAIRQGRRAARSALTATEAGQADVEASLWLNFVRAWYGVDVANEVVLSRERALESAQRREQALVRLPASSRRRSFSCPWSR